MSTAAQAMLATLSRTPGTTRGGEAGRLEMSGIDAEMEMLRCMTSSFGSPSGSLCHRPKITIDQQRLGVLAPSGEIQAAGVGLLAKVL